MSQMTIFKSLNVTYVFVHQSTYGCVNKICSKFQFNYHEKKNVYIM